MDLDDSDDDDNDDTDDEDSLDEDAILEHRSVPHLGGVNRVRAQPLPQSAQLPPVSQPYHAATWAETGKVHIWNIRPLIESLDVPGYTFDRALVSKPVFTINSHGTAEGFAMDWASSGPSSLRLLTGDIHSNIYLTTSTPSGFNSLSQPFLSHTSSIEDLQWSPSEPTVFSSCSADSTIHVWDVRSKGRRSVAGIDGAHESDVNVISWNRSTTYLLLSGGDDGEIRVWDLRNVKKKGYALRLSTSHSHSLQSLIALRNRILPQLLYSGGIRRLLLQLNGILERIQYLLRQALMIKSHCGILPSNRTTRQRPWTSQRKSRMYLHSCYLYIKDKKILKKFIGILRYQVLSLLQLWTGLMSSEQYPCKVVTSIVLHYCWPWVPGSIPT